MTTIVVGVDGSEGSREAVAWAVAEARVREARLDLVHAWEYPYAGEVWAEAWATSQREHLLLEEGARAVLDDALDRARELAPELHVTGALVRGPAGGALVEAALVADLIVVGSRGHGGFKGLLLGSVSRHVSHHPPCPVAIVHSYRPEQETTGRVVVGVDGSPASTAALRFALEEARRRKARLVALHAWSYPAGSILAVFTKLPTPKELAAAARATSERLIAEAGGPGGVEVELLAPEGHGAEALLAAAHDADLLVVGDRGGGHGALRLGSVSHACAQDAACPVVIVPSAD